MKKRVIKLKPTWLLLYRQERIGEYEKSIEWIGIVLASLIGLLIVAAVIAYFVGNARLNRVYDISPSNLIRTTDAASIEPGRHQAEVLCQGCHGEDLSGVENWFNAPPLGRIDSANLTSREGGLGSDFTTEDYVRAIRHGINREGKPIFMTAVISTTFLRAVYQYNSDRPDNRRT